VVDVVQLTDEPEGHVDTGRNAGGGDDVAVDDPACVAVELEPRRVAPQLIEGRPFFISRRVPMPPGTSTTSSGGASSKA
jgi:hypothetical protein